MAVTILGQPNRLSPAYNPLYFYASSTNATEPNFRYIVEVIEVATSTTIAELHIRPRYGDNYLEVDVAKIIQSRLATFIDDVDINANDNTWNNTISSGYEFRVEVGEEYLAEFDSNLITVNTSTNPDTIRFRFPLALSIPFVAGDGINISGASESWDYTSITLGSGGNAEINFGTTHDFSIGDQVTILQNSPFTYPQYNGIFTVTVDNANSIVINIPYQGASILPQTGSAIINRSYDGNYVVTQVTSDFSYYYVDTNIEAVDTPTTVIATVKYADSRLSQFTGLAHSSRATFNGVLGYNYFPSWENESADYYATTDCKFLTTVPDGWRVRPDNSVYLDFCSIAQPSLPGLTFFTQFNTYDSSNTLLGTYNMYNPLSPANKTLIQNIAAGPADLNSMNVILNGDFSNGSYWAISNFLGGIGQITNDTFVYLDNVTGDGNSNVVQANTLVPGVTYTVIMTTNSNNFVLISIGDENDTYTIVTQGQNGTYAYTFTATGTDFWMVVESAGGVTQGVIIDDISVVTSDGVIDCNVDHYTVQVFKAALSNVILNGSFTSGANWVISDFGNADTDILGGSLNYTDSIDFAGTGYSIVGQTSALTIGVTYTVTVSILNNVNCTVSVGDTNTLYQTAYQDEVGNYSVIFTATATEFIIRIDGTDAIVNGLEMTAVTVSSLTTSAQSELRTFNLDCSCTGRYTNYPLLFMDRFGSFIPFNFELNNKQKVDINRKKFQRFVGDLNTALTIDGYSYSLTESSSRIYNIELEEEWELNTGWLTETEAVYMEELYTSPLVFIGVQGTWIAVNILDTTFERIRKNNKKLIKHTVKFLVANNNNIQSA